MTASHTMLAHVSDLVRVELAGYLPDAFAIAGVTSRTNATTQTTIPKQVSLARRRPPGWTRPKPPLRISFRPAGANAPRSPYSHWLGRGERSEAMLYQFGRRPWSAPSPGTTRTISNQHLDR